MPVAPIRNDIVISETKKVLRFGEHVQDTTIDEGVGHLVSFDHFLEHITIHSFLQPVSALSKRFHGRFEVLEGVGHLTLDSREGFLGLLEVSRFVALRFPELLFLLLLGLTKLPHTLHDLLLKLLFLRGVFFRLKSLDFSRQRFMARTC